MTQKRYPVPGPTGGRLIRKLISLLKAHHQPLPIDSHILIAFSGGLDSTALARLLIRYGRRVVADPKRQITLLHINHGWRGEESDGDETFAREQAAAWGVPIRVKRLKGGKAAIPAGESWESFARDERQRVFAQELGRFPEGKAWVLTAHHGDDLAETVLWRLLTGAGESHGGGIAVRLGQEVRPLLTIRKAELRRFLEEESQSWREDAGNHEGRFLRSRMRLGLMKEIEALFPKGVEHLMQSALQAQTRVQPRSSEPTQDRTRAFQSLLGAAGLEARRPHWEAFKSARSGGLDLPGGWRLERVAGEKWVLEKSSAARKAPEMTGKNSKRPRRSN